jgi:hypothetical protein
MNPALLWGLMVEFERPADLVDAARRAREAGYRRMDAYSPMPVHGLDDAMEIHERRVPLLVLGGALTGALSGLALQYWTNAVDYPLNVGGRPLFSWPMAVPIIFEMTILFAALTAVFGMLALNGLPRPYHPVFNVPRFALASRNRFFLCIEARDPKFDLNDTRKFLESLDHSRGVCEVER